MQLENPLSFMKFAYFAVQGLSKSLVVFSVNTYCHIDIEVTGALHGS